MKMKKMSFFGLPIKRQISDFVINDEEGSAMHIHPNIISAPALVIPKHIDPQSTALHLHPPHLVALSRKLTRVATPRPPAPRYETSKAALLPVNRGQQSHCPSISTPIGANIAELPVVKPSPRSLLNWRQNPSIGCSNKRLQSYAIRWPQGCDGHDLSMNNNAFKHTDPHSDDITDRRGWCNLHHRNETFPPSLSYKPSSQHRSVNRNLAPRTTISTERYILNGVDVRDSHRSVPKAPITCSKTKESSIRTSSTDVTKSYAAVRRMQTSNVGINPFSSRASSLEAGRQLAENNPYLDRAITISYDDRELDEPKIGNSKEQHPNTTFERADIYHTSHGDDTSISPQPTVPESVQLTQKRDEPRPRISKSYFAGPICDQSQDNRDTVSDIIAQSGKIHQSTREKIDTEFIERHLWSEGCEARSRSKSISPIQSRVQSITGQEAMRQEVATPKRDLSRDNSDCVDLNETEDDSPESLLSLFNRRRKAGYYNCQPSSQTIKPTQNDGVKNDVPKKLSLNLLNDPIVVTDPVHGHRRPPIYTIEVISLSTKPNPSNPSFKSTPMRIQSPPGTKKTDITRSSTPAKPELSKLKQIPKTQKRKKTNKLLISDDQDVLRQRQVASLIESKEIEVERIELGKTLFSETDSGGENRKAKRLKIDAKKDFKHQPEFAAIIQVEDRQLASLKTVQGRPSRVPLSRKCGKKITPGGKENHFLKTQVYLDLLDDDGDEDDGDSLFISDKVPRGYVCQTTGESVGVDTVSSPAKAVQSKATQNELERSEKMRQRTPSEKRVKKSQNENDLSNTRANRYYHGPKECQETLSLKVQSGEKESMPTKTFREQRKAKKTPPDLVTQSSYEGVELSGLAAKLTGFENIINDRWVHQTQPKPNNDQEVEFSWSPMGPPKIGLVKVAGASQVPSITATKNMHVNSAGTVSGVIEVSDATNLHAHPQSLAQKITQQSKFEKLKESTNKQRVDQSKKGRIDHQDADWRKIEHKNMAERKRKEILPEITRPVELSDILMEKKEDLRYRSSKRAQKAAKVPTSQQDCQLQRPVPPMPQVTRSCTRDGEDLTVDEMMRKQTEATRKKRQAIARERNTAFHLAAMKKTVENIETDSESDEDENSSAVIIQRSGGKTPSSEGDYDEIKFDFESNDDELQPLIGGQYQSLYSLSSTGILSPLELHPRNITLESRINLSSKRSSLLPKNILDLPVKSVLAGIMPQRSPDIMLVNIYRIIQQRVRGDEATEPKLVDNYALSKDAENRILAELQKFRDSGIAIYSCTTEPHPDTKLLSARIIHTKKKDTYTDWNIEVETRLSDTLSGYDPELFTPIFQPLIYNVIQQNILKDQYVEEVVDEETGELQPGANWSSKVLASMTSLQMANAAACEEMVKLTKPDSQRIDEISVHSDLAKQLRETVDSCDRAMEGMSAELTSDEDCLPWLKYGTLKIFVEEQQLKGPRN